MIKKNYDNENIKDKRIHIWDCNKFISKTFIHNFFCFFEKPLKKLRDEKKDKN